MRALLVSHSAELYGAERSLLSLASGLARRGAIEPVVLLPAKGPLCEALGEAGVECRIVPHARWISRRHKVLGPPWHLAGNLLAGPSLRRAGRELRPDVVLTNTLTTPAGARIARALDVPHVWHAREFVYEDHGARFDLGLFHAMRRIARTADLVVCNSEAVLTRWRPHLPGVEAAVVYNGVESPAEPPPGGGEKYASAVAAASPVRLLMLGSISPGKGQHDAVAALAKLTAAGGDYALVLAGGGAERELVRVRATAARHDVTDRVVMPGFTKDPAALLAESAVLLVCSRREAFGRVAVEAGLAGTPVVGLRAGGIPEVVEDGVTGLLVTPGDPAALAGAVGGLVADRALYGSMVDAAPVRMRERFGVERYVEEMERLLVSASSR